MKNLCRKNLARESVRVMMTREVHMKSGTTVLEEGPPRIMKEKCTKLIYKSLKLFIVHKNDQQTLLIESVHNTAAEKSAEKPNGFGAARHGCYRARMDTKQNDTDAANVVGYPTMRAADSPMDNIDAWANEDAYRQARFVAEMLEDCGPCGPYDSADAACQAEYGKSASQAVYDLVNHLWPLVPCTDTDECSDHLERDCPHKTAERLADCVSPFAIGYVERERRIWRIAGRQLTGSAVARCPDGGCFARPGGISGVVICMHGTELLPWPAACDREPGHDCVSSGTACSCA